MASLIMPQPLPWHPTPPLTRTFLAPAKINLALRVVGKRDDGYHLLQSVLAFFPLFDQLTITLCTEGLKFSCDPPVTATQEENLVYRAAQALLQASGQQRGAHLQLKKQIPNGAGLGGGSSDAALTLLALNQMWALGFTTAQLLAIGVKIGADLPFFIAGQTALVQGIGEQLTPLPLCPTTELVLIFPTLSLSTARVFHALAGSLPPARAPLVLPDQPSDLLQFLENDLQPPAIALAPIIGTAMTALQQAGAQGTLMSGSGSSVFGLFPTPATAQHAKDQLTAKYPEWQIFSGTLFHHHPFFKQ